MCVCNIYKYMCVSVRLFVCAAALLAQTGPLALIENAVLYIFWDEFRIRLVK